MYEMLSWSHEVGVEEGVTKGLLPIDPSDPDRKYHVFCNAELPGGFIGALNQYIHGNLKKDWDWLACSLISGQHLGDSFGIYRRYPWRWLQTKKMNGDVTEATNLVHIRDQVLNKFPKGVDLYTSDAGCDVSKNYNAQEELLSLLPWTSVERVNDHE